MYIQVEYREELKRVKNNFVLYDINGQVCGCCKKQLTAGAFPKWFCLRNDCEMYLKPQILR